MRSGAERVHRIASRTAALGGRVLHGAARNWGLLVLLLIGAVIRGLVVYSYQPVFFFPDSVAYLDAAAAVEPHPVRPWGYSGFLALLEPVVPFDGLAVVQHVLGLATGVLLYALLRRRGVRRWIACLAVAPVLLDGYLIQIEHYVLAESLYVFLLAGALVLLLWSERPPWWAAAGAGVVFALGAVTRTVGVAVLAVVGVYLLARLVRRTVGWRPVVALGLGVLSVLLPYMAWFHSQYGVYALTDYTGHFLYGRVSLFVECDRVDVPRRLAGLCPTEPVAERPGMDWYVWDVESPANSGRYTEEELAEFGRLAIGAQFLDYAGGTAWNTLHYFLPGRTRGEQDYCLGFWEFPEKQAPASRWCQPRLAVQGYDGDPVDTTFRTSTAPYVAGYQDWVHTPGPVLAALALVGLSAVVPSRRWPRGSVLDEVFCVAVALALVVLPSATSLFDYRYGLPMLVVLPVGAALATRRWTARAPTRPAPGTEPHLVGGSPSSSASWARTGS